MAMPHNILMHAKLRDTVTSNKVVLFMKGSPSFPLCGMSAHVCFWLKRANIYFHPVNVLYDPSLHIFLRELHSPSSVPYLYSNNKFIGGYDEIKYMMDSHELELAVA